MRYPAFVAIVGAFACRGREPPARSEPPAEAPRAVSVDAPDIAPPITLAMVGDIMIGSLHPGAELPPEDGAQIFAQVATVLGGADVALGNLEGPLYDGSEEPHCTRTAIAERHRGRPGRDCWSFRMPTRYAHHLRAAGFDALSIANNHVDDFGAAGVASTIEALDRVGIRHSGATGTVAHLVVRDRAIDIIAFATYPGLNDLDELDAARELVTTSVKRGALVVVSFHGGAEGADATRVPDGAEQFWGERRGSVKAFAHAMIDAGASLVFGHGPHVLRGLELRNGRLIAYSLGTFATYRAINVTGSLGITAILEAQLGADGRFLGGKLVAIRQRPPGGPALDSDGDAIRVMRELSRADFGAAAPAIDDDGTLRP